MMKFSKLIDGTVGRRGGGHVRDFFVIVARRRISVWKSLNTSGRQILPISSHRPIALGMGSLWEVDQT